MRIDPPLMLHDRFALDFVCMPGEPITVDVAAATFGLLASWLPVPCFEFSGGF